MLLVVSSQPRDPGLDRAVEVRRFLADLGVPLYVWATDGAAPAGWGQSSDVSTAPLPHRLELIESEEVRLAR